jgi:hypothetical protein
MEPTKECFKCHSVLPLSSFYAHPAMSDGHVGKCKECNKRDVRERYALTRISRSEYERRRRKDPSRRDSVNAYLKRYASMYPERRRAHQSVARAIRTGRLVRSPCEACGTTIRIQAHHDDYAKPLDVRWLCFKHHREIGHGQVVVAA